jgi:hypothetical protein
MKKRVSELIGIISLCFFSYISDGQNDKSFLSCPRLMKDVSTDPQFSPENRRFTGIPSLAVSNKGRFWAVWYAGKTPGEDQNNYIVVSTSEDHGDHWEEVLIIDPDGDGPVRAFDPEVWIDPEGRLWIFWAQSVEHTGTIAGVWSLTADDPEIENPIWTDPKRLTDGIMMCKPIVLSGGEWFLPVSTWKLTDNSAKAMVSQDKGMTWHIRGAVDVPTGVRDYDEHMIVEKKDGSLWMLVRTKYGIGESISKDKGISWSPLVPSTLQHPSARFFIRRLMSGKLLLVKHGPAEMKTGRSHLMAFISNDDGQSWSRGLLMDERTGVSYPDGQQSEDGTIYVIYDYNRKKDQMIYMTSFRENDIEDHNYDSRIVELFNRRKTVSKGGQKENFD